MAKNKHTKKQTQINFLNEFMHVLRHTQNEKYDPSYLTI